MKSEAVEAKARLAIFVGEEAYKAAGGSLTRDLFSEEVLFRRRRVARSAGAGKAQDHRGGTA